MSEPPPPPLLPPPPPRPPLLLMLAPRPGWCRALVARPRAVRPHALPVPVRPVARGRDKSLCHAPNR
eukprot:365107-Chlamydomonas_euryale.AAC.6